MKVIAILFLAALASSSKLLAWKRFHQITGPRITGGEEVTPNSVPWQVGLNIYGAQGNAFCGGSLITANTVLTAAHCCELADTITAILGAHAIRNVSETTQQQINVANVTIHYAWDSTQLINDICLLTLSKSANLNSAVNTIRIPTRAHLTDTFDGEKGTATGWGLDSEESTNISPVLKTTSNPVISNAKCRQEFGLQGLIIPLHPSNVCMTGLGGKSTCSGDSGGPLTILDGFGTPFQIGLTSFGSASGCEKERPSVFTRLTSYLDWLQLHGVPVS